ncbi:hypothetical protein [Streptomyces spirodelae]|uniref:Uncharacterized protein n=1 Tax=Streptomyces spirodelae TaxID=2812904 RepID=A0ABS3X0L6_9ACTN|nr:hypothetical protein [Streptomyces spirodelae]MBO8188881.1 hypothetical protein [Streptomyces spirodelae]
MPEPTGPRRIRPRRLARQLLDEELKAAARQSGARQNPAWGPAPPQKEQDSLGRAADDVADEMLRFLRGLWRRLLRNRQGQQRAEDPGAGQEYQPPPPGQGQGPEPQHFPPQWAQQPWHGVAPQQAAQGPARQQPSSVPGFVPQHRTGFAPQGQGFAPYGTGYAPPPPGGAVLPPPQQPGGRRRLMKQQPEGNPSAFEQYGSLRDRPEQQAAVQDEVRKLMNGRTRYREAARRNMLPFAASLAALAESNANNAKRSEKNTEAPKSERSWLSRLNPWRSARPGNAQKRSAKADPAAVPGARLATPPRLPQLSDYASGQLSGPGPQNAVTQAVARAAAPARGDSAAHTPGPPVPPKVPNVPPKIPLDTPGAEPARSRSSSPADTQPSPPSTPVSPPASPTVPPVSPVSRSVSPVSSPALPVSPPSSPVFSPAVAGQSLEHHRSNSEARGKDTSMSRSSRPQSPHRAPAAQQSDTAKRAPSRGR